MNTTVGALHCEYRAVGGGAAPGPVELEHELRAHLAPTVAGGLDVALAGDPTVYAIRRLDCEVTLRGDGRSLPDLARRTGGAVTNAILRALGDGAVPGSARPAIDSEVVTFADEAEFVAQFVVDLLEDRAHGCWYYASFGDTRDRPRPEVLASVLAAPGAVTWRALGRIFARGYLERLLDELPGSTWALLSGMGAGASDDSLRPMLSAALTLLTGVVEPMPDREQLFRSYANSGPRVPDWQDRRSLAEGVLEAVSFLLRSTHIRLDADAAARIRAAATATALDWLDTATLLAGIERMTESLTGAAAAFAAPSAAPSAATASAAVPARLSARQRAILRDLAAACRAGLPGLDVQSGDCPANRLRLQAALTAHDERWADDPVVGELIGALLRELAQGAGTEGPLLRELAALGAGVDGPLLRELGALGASRAGSSSARSAPPGSAVHGIVRDSGEAESIGVYSEVAGVALLIRAALDIRLPLLASTVDFLPGRDALVAALMALAPTGSPEPDPALSLILAAEMPPPRLPDEGSPRHAFEAKLLGALAARGLLEGDPAVVATEIAGLPALIGGIAQPAVWPLMEIVRDPREAGATVARWGVAWSEATGEPEPRFARTKDDTPLALALSAVLDERGIASPAHLTMTATGLALLRVWGHWLPGVGRSSLRYLLDLFIHRPGTVSRVGDVVRVRLERRELDMVLELSGLLASIDARRSLGAVIHFELTSP